LNADQYDTVLRYTETTIMKSATEKTAHDPQASSTVSVPTKRPWHAPEIEEVDFAETQASLNPVGGDGGFYS
jgi:hypothetical protein